MGGRQTDAPGEGDGRADRDAPADHDAADGLDADAIRAYDRRAPGPEATERATFGLGCFWGPDAQFGGLEGVVRTRVGYAGGSTPDPTYHDLGDHTEVVQVDFDPELTSYADLLEVAFDAHDPRHQPRKRQYQHLVLTADDEQREAVAAFLAERDLDSEAVETRIEELSSLYLAEDYHQKYHLRSKRWITAAFDDAGYDDAALRESPAAATLDAVAAGHDVADARALGVGGAPDPGRR